MASRRQVAGGARAVLAALLVAVLVLSLLTLFTRSVQNRAITDSLDLRVSERLDNQRSTIDEQDDKLGLLEAQLEGLGEEPVVRSDGVGRPTLVTLPPSDAALQAAVAAYCSVEDCAASSEELDARIAAYCATTGACRGEDGAAAPPPRAGRDGADGSRGPRGRGVERFDCVDGVVRATYTDGATQTVTSWSCSPPASPPDDNVDPSPEESP